MKKKLILPVLLSFIVVGCSKQPVNNPDLFDLTDNTVYEEFETNTTDVAVEQTDKSVDFSLPQYSNAAVVELNGNKPDFTETEKESTEAFEIYSSLDSLGRCGRAYANICKELMPTKERGEIGSVRPTGWHTVKYNGLVDGNYLYNRCHLIAFCLAGENANEKNLITGTRYLNINGMLPYEEMVAEYVDNTDNHVLYRVTPVFEGNNLVASGVQIEAWSVEDDGNGICFNIYCFNVQPGVMIDYATGESWKDTEGTPNISDNTEVEEKTYIINTNTKKFHLESCEYGQSVSEKNKEIRTCSKTELLEEGYAACKSCNP